MGMYGGGLLTFLWPTQVFHPFNLRAVDKLAPSNEAVMAQ